MRKKPYHSEELFEVLCTKLKEKGQMPENLEYSLPCREKYLVDTYEVVIHNNLDFGGNEGIYLNLRLYLRGEEKQFGTFKTLGETREDMIEMATLLANFITEFRDFVGDNMDDFSWDGYEVNALKEDGSKESWGWECATLEKALERKDQLLEKHGRVVIRDNRTRKETLYENTFKPFKTDDLQWLITREGKSYTFAEVRKYFSAQHDDFRFAAFKATIDLEDYSEEDKNQVAEYYYNDGWNEVKRTYGNNSDQIIAECAFEMLQSGDIERVTLPFADEDEAMKALDLYVERIGGAA